MNVFNRVVMCLFLVAFIAVVIVLALIPKVVMQNARYALDVAEYNLDPASQLAGAVLGLIVAALALLLLLAELRPAPRRSVLVAKVGGGTAELTNESVAMRVKRTAESISGVREAVPTIRSRGKSVDIVLRLTVDPDLDLPQKSEELIQAVRRETEERMGIPVRSLKVTYRHTQHDMRQLPSQPVAPPPQSSSEV